MLIGAFWVLARFALVLTIARGALDGGMVAHVNLLWVGAATLIVALIFATAVYKPNLHGVFVPLLRISMILMVVSDIVVVLTGSYATRLAEDVGTEETRSSPDFTVTFAVLVVDLIVATALISYRPADPEHSLDEDSLKAPHVKQPPPHQPDDHLPPYRATDVEGE